MDARGCYIPLYLAAQPPQNYPPINLYVGVHFHIQYRFYIRFALRIIYILLLLLLLSLTYVWHYQNVRFRFAAFKKNLDYAGIKKHLLLLLFRSIAQIDCIQ